MKTVSLAISHVPVQFAANTSVYVLENSRSTHTGPAYIIYQTKQQRTNGSLAQLRRQYKEDVFWPKSNQFEYRV